MTLQTDCWRALIDPSQLSTALINLAVNARDAMAKGGKISFSTANVSFGPSLSDPTPERTLGDYVMITVSDTGAGIPAAIRDKVFEPFFTTKELGKGTGLGLSMVYGFVKQSGGHIKIDSEEGRGTTVSLYLPRGIHGAAPPRASGVEPTPRRERDHAGRRGRCPGARLCSRAAQSLGYRTITAANGPDALAFLNQEVAFDLLFTDIVMPGGMNGRELAEAVTRRRPGVAVLYMSGYPDAAIMHDGRLDPGVALLSKPYRQSDLARMIRQVLDQRNARGGLS